MTNSTSKLSPEPQEQQPTTNASVRECVICYESLSNAKNLCITECGHEFCFVCMMKHVQYNNGCPCCRATLIDEEDDDEETDNSSYSSITESDDEEDYEGYAVELLESEFIAKGYGLKDALSLFFRNFSKTDAKYTKEYIEKLKSDIDEIDMRLETEFCEQINMSEEDVNRA